MIPKFIYQRTGVTFSVERLLEGLEPFRHLLNGDNRQLCLTSRPGSPDPLREGAGWFDGVESDFSVFNEEFKGTIFEEIYHRVPYKLGRVRFMLMPPRACYSFHADKEPRLHIALVSNPNAYLLIDDDSALRSWKIKIPANGHVYWVNTQRIHTALNTDANEDRIHLVANILGPK
jgi:hypothetical protein